jgi:hypothetical protein
VPAADPSKIWRRKLRVGGHYWAERRDATWVRWSWLRADWEDMPGPPEGVRAAPPEGSVVAPVPAYAVAPVNPNPPRSLPNRLLGQLFPALVVSAVVGASLIAFAVVWNGIFGGFLEPIPLGPLALWVGLGCLALTVVLVAVQLALIRIGKGIRELFTPGPKGRRR